MENNKQYNLDNIRLQNYLNHKDQNLIDTNYMDDTNIFNQLENDVRNLQRFGIQTPNL